MNRRRMSGHRVASSAPPAGPANEIQTITVPNFVGATGFPFFSVGWPTYGGFGHSAGASGIEGMTAAQVAAVFQANFNDALEFTDPSMTDKTITVTGALDGSSLVLTLEFDGVGIAATDVEPAEPSDWDVVGMPVVATVQDGRA